MLLLADEDDLRDVRSAVADLAGRWQDLGVSLGIRPGDLEAIISISAHSPSDCLRKVLTLWLRKSYKVWTSPIPTLSPVWQGESVAGGKLKAFSPLTQFYVTVKWEGTSNVNPIITDYRSARMQRTGYI